MFLMFQYLSKVSFERPQQMWPQSFEVNCGCFITPKGLNPIIKIFLRQFFQYIKNNSKNTMELFQTIIIVLFGSLW